MSIFEDVTFGFDGEEYTVKSNKIMGLIHKVEGVMTFGELMQENPSLSKVAMAYTVCLKEAGCDAELEEVYAELFNHSGAQNIKNSILGLTMLMMPPATYQPPEKSSEKKPVKRKKKAE
jgi:hypothetical protein